VRIILAIVVVAGLLVAADFGFAALAEHRVSQQAREELDLEDDPSVTVHGFPFTTQALAGDYGHIEISVESLRGRKMLVPWFWLRFASSMSIRRPVLFCTSRLKSSECSSSEAASPVS
jgi:hypothetical protein